jgi:hypothetical protein
MKEELENICDYRHQTSINLRLSLLNLSNISLFFSFAFALVFSSVFLLDFFCTHVKVDAENRRNGEGNKKL